ncbi:MAG: type II CRISPR RNA-guided endonuclease Cas9, partial [Acholeplasmataceae bacterium]|nr:type II CRISPR RNA-guided endonuclease Cas9 [Acholeplasmataceae bacterium]
MKKQFGEYYLGLDMGTGSLGWAVTDLNYNLEKLHGKALWGIRLFDTANTAAACRIQRGARRRLERKSWRLKLLQELFAEEISRKDQGFYLRLKESNFWLEDKSTANSQKYSLFNDANYSDKDYYMDYPTIYHLRKALLENKKVFDVRLVYLAIHNILKYRGHFLFAGLKADAIRDFKRVFAEVRQYLRDNVIGLENWDCASLEMVENILKDKNISITTKKNQLEVQFSAQSKQEKAVVGLLAGGTVKLCDLFEDEELKEVEKPSLSFSKDNYDEIQQMLKEQLADRIEAVEKLKALYDWSLLVDILKGKEYISYAKVAVYAEHEQDLKDLKKIVKKYIPKEYKNIFGAQQGKAANYSSYIGMYKINHTKKSVQKKCNQKDICKFLSTKLKDIRSDDANLKIIRDKLALGIFLPKQVDKNNGIIPMQIHLVELEKILENASAYLPFLNNVDEAGNTIKSKIIDIMKFRIPYYVVPLNGPAMSNAKKRCWVVRSSDKIYPWNFEKVVNLEASAENFIRNMTNKCTYLVGEDVLPKNSLLYTEFMVRNEINNLKIDGMS